MAPLQNTPEVKLGVVAVSRDCFPAELAARRLKRVMAECRGLEIEAVACQTIVETEADAVKAVAEMRAAEVNALVVYLGNFGPEGPATILAQTMGVPFMLVGASEESRDTLVEGRGDAFCGMLSVCFNAGLRNLRPFLPPKPVGLPEEVAANIAHFQNVARVVIGLKSLKVFAFGPRPQDFFACNAPIKPLYDLGIEVMENSELDLLEVYREVEAETGEIGDVARDMAEELGAGNQHPEKLKQLAQFEIALRRFFEENLGSRPYGVYANKCWPGFEPAFGFVPCFVNSRMAGSGIPVACEVDIYGAVSEYALQLASMRPATLLDINNTVPGDLEIGDLAGAARGDLFMGFHCGNTPSCCLCDGYCMKYQLIMNRLMEEPGATPDITCGTLEGRLRPGPTTVFRLQATPDGAGLMSYIAEGNILDTDFESFGCIAVFALPDFARFYRYVLLEKQFAHHTGTSFRHCGRVIYDALEIMGIDDVATPRPAGCRYPNENPFA